MKIRILRAPGRRDLEGVKLDSLVAGTIRELSASVASWLVTEGYAAPEMRHAERAVAAERGLRPTPGVGPGGPKTS